MTPGETVVLGAGSYGDCTGFAARGTLLAALSVPFTTTTGNSSGTLISAVYQEASGTLDFYYQVVVNTTSTNCGSTPKPPCDPIARVTMSNFNNSGFWTTWAATRGDAVGPFGAGVVFPITADRNSGGDVVGFSFQPPDDSKIQPGTASGILVVSTNATSYTIGHASVIDGGTTTVPSFQPGVPNTPTGSNVSVQPTDPTTGTTPATVTFNSITTAGMTSVTSSSSGPPPTSGFDLGSPAIYYDISTTAAFTAPVKVCINYAGITFPDPLHPGLNHYEGGNWVDRTILPVDTTNMIICASVNSLSPFAIFSRPDLTPPVISATVMPNPNLAGWNNGAVNVTWSVSDSGSGILSSTGCNSAQLTADTPGATLTCSALDRSGNRAQSSVTIKIDTTPPTIALSSRTAANAAGWNKTAVSLLWTCSDALSGAAQASVGHQVSAEGANQSSTGTCLDLAGNSASNTQTAINIDFTSPNVQYTGNAGTYTVDQSVNIACTASDSLSGVAATTCVNVSGPAYSFNLGTDTFSATATDKAGNVGTGSVSFTVQVTVASLSNLTQQFVTQPGIANSMVAKLTAGSINAYINEVSSQAGKALTTDQAAILIRLAQAL
jgi:hypothetical protein